MLKTFVEWKKKIGKKINKDLHWQNKQNKIIKINNVIMQHKNRWIVWFYSIHKWHRFKVLLTATGRYTFYYIIPNHGF